MMRTVFSVALILSLMVFSCGGPSPLKDGLTTELEEEVTWQALDEIYLAEVFDPGYFEEAQLDHFEIMHESLKGAAMDHLDQRVAEIKDLDMAQDVLLDEDTIELSWKQISDTEIRVEFSVEGERMWTTKDGEGGARTRYSLPWTLVVEKGEVMYYHHGIRSSNL